MPSPSRSSTLGIVAVVLGAALGGCAPAPWLLPRGSALTPPASAPATGLPIDAWVAQVAVEDRTLSRNFPDAMTLSLRDYLDATHVFRNVALLGRPEPDDIVQRLVVERYVHVEQYDPWYLPLYALTIRLYALLGGTRTIETQEMTARLEVARGSGTPIGAVGATASDRATHTFYRAFDDRPGVALRSRVVQELLDRAMPLVRKAYGC